MVDLPEVDMPATAENTGGNVEHQIYTVERLAMLVGELKCDPDSGGRTKRDNFAQVMVELACASTLPLATGY